MIWYRPEPYAAYFAAVRYQDVIDLATLTLKTMSEPLLEESFYWRARAYLAMGDSAAASEDLQSCLLAHPGYAPCIEVLISLPALEKKGGRNVRILYGAR